MQAKQEIRGLVKHTRDWQWSRWVIYHGGVAGRVEIDVDECEGEATPRPRFKQRTWGTLRVVLGCEGAKVPWLVRGRWKNSGLLIPGHTPLGSRCLRRSSWDSSPRNRFCHSGRRFTAPLLFSH